MLPIGNDKALSDGLVSAVQTITRGHVIVDGVILSVDTVNYVADVQVGDSLNDTTYYAVPLAVLIQSQASFILIPSVNSNCLLFFRDGNLGRPQLLSYDQVDYVYCNANKGVVFNGGNKGGLVDIGPLMDAINTMQNDLNNLKQDFTSWTPVPNDGGSALKTITATWAGKQITVTQRSDVEDTSVSH